MKIRKLTALLLTLCMIFSLSVAAFAAEPEAHTIYDSAPDEEATVSATVSRSQARMTSRGRLSGSRSRRSGLMIWTHCISLTLRTGLKTVSI